MALDVADHQADPATGGDGVVPVTADLHALGAGQVAGGDPDGLHGGQPVRQQRVLEAAGEGELGVVQPGAFQRLGDEAAEGGEQAAFLRGEGPGLVEAEDAAADGVAGGDQRQEGPGAHLVER